MPSACRSKPEIVFTPAVLLLTYSCPTTVSAAPTFGYAHCLRLDQKFDDAAKEFRALASEKLSPSLRGQVDKELKLLAGGSPPDNQEMPARERGLSSIRPAGALDRPHAI